jgi:hypothetical protein
MTTRRDKATIKGDSGREQRLAEALRENLVKRKQRARRLAQADEAAASAPTDTAAATGRAGQTCDGEP